MSCEGSFERFCEPVLDGFITSSIVLVTRRKRGRCVSLVFASLHIPRATSSGGEVKIELSATQYFRVFMLLSIDPIIEHDFVNR